MLSRNRAVLGAVFVLGGFAAFSRHEAPFKKINDCPHYWTSGGGGPIPGDSIPLIGSITNVPEYHDCQRFVGRNMRYLDIAAVWVREDIRGFYERTMSLSPPNRPGAASALVGGQPANFNVGDSSGAALATTRVGVVGIIWSDGPYKDLGLIPGWSCLVMNWKMSGTAIDPTSYGGRTVHVAKADLCSKLTVVDMAKGYPLAVTALAPRTGDVSPPVARWDWDDSLKVQYVSMWCPTGWCEFHNKHYKSSPVWDATIAPYSASAGMFVRQKGYYDEQILADPLAGGGRLDGTLVRGTIFPEPGLETRSVTSYTGHWLPVARVSMSKASPGYLSKYLYKPHPGAPDGRDNLVSLCFKAGGPLLRESLRPAESAELMKVKAGTPSVGARPIATPVEAARSVVARLTCSGTAPQRACPKDDKNVGYWYMKVTNPDNAERLYCVHYRKAPSGVTVPGIVRWRWTWKDEIIWIGCPQGCCEGDGWL